MRLREWFRPPRHVLTIFLSVALLSGGALGWLGWLLLEQDNAVESQRRREQLDEGADRAVAVMQRELARLAARLGAQGVGIVDDVSVVSLSAKGIAAQPPLLYYPEAADLPEAPVGTFTEAERMEFTVSDPAPVIGIYEKLTASPDAAVPAGSWTRLARIYRKQRDAGKAERAYDRLAQIPDVAVEGLPASLIAREGRANLFSESRRTSDLQREAAAFQEDLQAGRWQLTKQQYEFYSSEAANWLGKASAADRDALARAEAFLWLWNNRPVWVEDSQRTVASALVLVRHAGKQEWHAAVAGPRYLDWLCRQAVRSMGVRWTLADLEGRTILGGDPPARDDVVRMAAATGLPWTLHVFPSGGAGGSTSRRRLLLWVFAVLAAVLSAGTYFILRAISRELRVARLQSDFVAAVSHEFRSPLSSLSQISEMLARDRFPSEEHRRRSYGVLERETERLRRLVEGLLDFGRFEAGAALYRFEAIEANAFLRELVAEFQARVAQEGFVVELSAPSRPLQLRADREALSRAIWNLLDNAVKYSPECRTVWVDVACEGERISIVVRDRGLGIPLHEQREIFERFVRGTESKTRRIKGTGIGLAMVRHIVAAHGGEIRLASEPGHGSQFTMVLHALGGDS
ncbi:MAG: HAMP domain-containing histidine kinase [Acidobacteria bacterium]|nr:HAMP domain-containing histidine kinase [Acidobacteriota bacterium]